MRKKREAVFKILVSYCTAILSKPSVKTLLPACCLALLLTACLIPEEFEAKIHIGKDGSYTLRFDGILTHVLVRQAYLAGQPVDQNNAEVKKLEEQWSKESGWKKVSYLDQGRFRVSYESGGKLDSPVYFISDQLKYVSIIPTSEGRVEVQSFKVSAKDVAGLAELKIAISGRLEVTTDAQVISHNATSTPRLLGLIGAYTWQIKSPKDEAPSMALMLEGANALVIEKQVKEGGAFQKLDYRSQDDSQRIVLISPSELEWKSTDSMLRCEYSREKDRIRAVRTGPTKEVQFFQVTPEGLVGQDGVVLYDMTTYDLVIRSQEAQSCRLNLKNIGLAARIWAIENPGPNRKDFLPSDFRSMAQYLTDPRILVCPADRTKTPGMDWNRLSTSNQSYEMISPGAPESNGNRVYVKCPLHNFLVLVDGSVQSGGYSVRSLLSETCDENLRLIEQAKAKLTADLKKTKGMPVTESEVVTYLRGSRIPVCPFGGAYRFNVVGEPPTCSCLGKRNMLTVAQFQSPKDICVGNLTWINGGKIEWAMDKKKGEGSTVTESDLAVYRESNLPKCPSGGVYVLNRIGTVPTCSLAILGHKLLPPVEKSPQDVCIANLRQIDGAKEQWALENKKRAGSPVTESNVAVYLYGEKVPRCPSGGVYTLNAIDMPPTCAVNGHSLSRSVPNAEAAEPAIVEILEAYPLLSQKEAKNYRDQSLLKVYDTLPDQSRKELVPNLACAATVYTMLERGRGNQSAMIDDFYIDPRKHGGDGPGARRPEYVGADIEIDSNRILRSLQEKQPVILHGYGGPLLEHFVLVVGSRTDAAGRRLVAFDPYPGSDRDEPGRQIEITVANGAMNHPTLSAVVFRHMRLIKDTESSQATVSTSPAPGTDSVTMNDGTTLTGKIEIPSAKFKTTYGEVAVKMNEFVSFQDNFLTLNDGSKLKGNFSEGKFSFATARGVLNLPANEIVRIVRASSASNVLTPSPAPESKPAPPLAATRETGSVLVGRVLDNFRKPLPGATVSIVNSRFTGLTDEQGNYAVTYVPGKIQVAFGKAGYYQHQLSFEISVGAKYPVQDVMLFKVPPGAGVFFVGQSDYTALSKSEVRFNQRELQGGGLSGSTMEWRYSVVGSATSIKPAGTVTFLDNDSSQLALYRVSPNNEFYRKTMVGIGLDFKHQYDLIQDTSRNTQGILLRSVTLDPGLYVFAAGNREQSFNIGGGHPVHGPCYFFRVDRAADGPKAAGSAVKAPGLGSTEKEIQNTIKNPKLARLLSGNPEANNFPEFSQEFSQSFERVWTAVQQALKKQKDKTRREDKINGTIIAEQGPWALLKRYVYVIVIESEATSTKVTFHLQYFKFGEKDQKNSLIRVDEKTVQDKAQTFLANIAANLKQ